MLRRALIAAAACAVAGVLGAPALAAPPAPIPLRPGGIDSVTTTHFKVWYDGDATQPDYITQTQAAALAGMAENAYSVETGLGFQPPVDDGDGHVDIYVIDLSTWPGLAGVAYPDAATAPTSGSIDVGASQIDTDWEQHTIAHELFHLIQFRDWMPANADHWLLEGEAEWAGYKVDSYGLAAGSTGPPELSLDCFDALGLDKCSPDGYTNGGYSRWSFYEYLADRFGPTFLSDALVQAQLAGSAMTGLENAISARGGSLGDVFDDYTTRQMTGGWAVPALDASPPATAGTVTTGTLTAHLGSQTYTVDHLAAKYIGFTRGDGAGDHPCFAATLTVTVTAPAGVDAKPVFWWNGAGSAPVALAMNGATGTATVPWDTCFWASDQAYLSLNNASTDIDAAKFVVSTSLTVDPNTPASATAPPPQATVWGGVTNVSNADAPPSIDVLGPLLLHVSSTSPTLRLIVQSTGDGTAHATLGSVDLGTPTLRAGNNDLRFTIPKSVLTSLRRSSAAGNVLVLTPLSPSGAVTGTAVTRAVAVTAAPKPKAKPKPKKKK